jgi:shikimate dehydrogenase
MKKKFAVLGYPVKHSLSPKIFNILKEHFALDFSYELLEIKPENFLSSLETLKGFDGLNVTSPYKEKILEFCKSKSIEVETLRAANVLRKTPTDKFEAFNTDVYGFKESLKLCDVKNMKALVLGSSGAAKAAILGLNQLGVTDISVKARNYSSLKDLHIPFQEYVDQKPELVIQATTLGMGSVSDEDLNFFKIDYSKTQIAYDLIYSPKETSFMQVSKTAGVPFVMNGESMLIHQALKTFDLWFDLKVEKNVSAKIKEIL